VIYSGRVIFHSHRFVLAGALLALATSCSSGEEPRFRPVRAHAEDRARQERAASRAATPPPASSAADEAPAAPEPGQAPAIGPVQAEDPRLLQPSQSSERAPDVFVAELDTTEGPIRIEVHRDWAPHGADRFWNLVRLGYYTDVAFFRVISGFVAQAGIHGRPEVNAAWRNAHIPDDPVVQSNTRGMVSYATGGPGTRTTQFFINLVDNTRLDGMGFAPFGRVLDMSAVDRLYAGYGEGAPSGRGPMQARIQREGNAYLRAEFPELDYIRSARIVSPAPGEAARPAATQRGR
jgi:peptidyl-prolyl cis-trans isomerase A (cyclophilin A)